MLSKRQSKPIEKLEFIDSFAFPHALAYSTIGYQTLYISTKYDPIYWDTACLIVNSGAMDPDNSGQTDYGKTAKALGEIRKAKIQVSLPDVNSSKFTFRPDAENHKIIYGLKGMLNVGDDVISKIIANRPYVSIKDFVNKVQPDKRAMVSLIKSGAFDNFMDRKLAMGWYLNTTAPTKTNLTLQNMTALLNYHILPENNDSINLAINVYQFNKYLKANCKVDDGQFKLNDISSKLALGLLNRDVAVPINEDGETISAKLWNKVYQKAMDAIRNWLAANKQEALKNLNAQIFLEEWNKYAKDGNLSAWEMETLCFYYHDHELKNIPFAQYGIVPFNSLPQEPAIERTFQTRNGYNVNIFKLYRICGTCIAKNKTRSTVSLLTPEGEVVNVKFRKEYFSLFDKQISTKGEDGVKHVLEKSWFNRGSKIIVNGFRSGDDFIVKKYASTPGHELYKITSIEPFTIVNQRQTGVEEDDEEA